MIPETGTLLIWLGGAGLVLMALAALLGTGRRQVTDRLATVSGDSVVGGIAAGGAAGVLNADSPLDKVTRRRWNAWRVRHWRSYSKEKTAIGIWITLRKMFSSASRRSAFATLSPNSRAAGEVGRMRAPTFTRSSM